MKEGKKEGKKERKKERKKLGHLIGWVLSKVQVIEMKFFRAILTKTMKDRIRNTNITLKLGVDEIKKAFKRAY